MTISIYEALRYASASVSYETEQGDRKRQKKKWPKTHLMNRILYTYQNTWLRLQSRTQPTFLKWQNSIFFNWTQLKDRWWSTDAYCTEAVEARDKFISFSQKYLSFIIWRSTRNLGRDLVFQELDSVFFLSYHKKWIKIKSFDNRFKSLKVRDTMKDFWRRLSFRKWQVLLLFLT